MSSYLSEFPEYGHLIAQWHPTKNGDKTPDNTRVGSGIEVWWVCPVSSTHEWESAPLTRASGKQGCPFCSGKRVLKGFNDLATTHRELASSWHPSLNTEFSVHEVSASSNKKAWWVCPIGSDHAWEATINSRKQGNKCPYCSNRAILAGFNDLGSSIEHKDIVAQWHPKNSLSPSEVSVASGKKVWWLCEDKHEWEAIVSNRTTKGSGCPICRKSSKPKKLATVAETALASEWHEDNTRSATEVTVGSSYNALWKCAKNHVWEAVVSNRIRGGGCLVCSGHKIVAGVNDLASSKEHAHLIAEWHPSNTLTPETVGLGTDVEILWICAEGHEWKANVYSRTHYKHGCPGCAGRTLQTENKLSVANYPALVAQWHVSNKTEPQEISFRSTRKVTWQCPKDARHVWLASPASRSLSGKDCPVCSGRLVIKGVNDLESNPAWNTLVSQWHPENSMLPSEVSFASSYRAKWTCTKKANHVWESFVYARTRTANPTECPQCAAALQVSRGENEIYEMLLKLGVTPSQSERRLIPGRELDMYLEEQKFAIEFNGLYWHSEAVRPDKFYHSAKLQACKDKGIYLYNVWEDDWRDRKSIVIRSIAHRIGATHKLKDVLPDMPDYWIEKLGARKTRVSELETSETREFLDTHHIQGFTSGNHYLGLKDNQDRLRALLVVSRTTEPGEYRIDRYASAGTISGGFTKLLNHAEDILDVIQWVTFADLGISDGALYENNGFVLDKVLGPDYSYLYSGKRVHKFNYRIQKFKKDPKLIFQEGLTERELADLNGLNRIWDFGKNRYVKEVVR
jgi:ssDNA-binding Zn-finger/Zn-ribbon topoisomerase 1